ncbi:MAG: thiolase domain-containing protein [Candidatus Bipolaricaulia bacterium]
MAKSDNDRDVYVIGVGITQFGVLEEPGPELLAEATLEAVTDAGVSMQEIEAIYLGNALGGFSEHQTHMGPLCASTLGLDEVPTTRFEDACATSSNALKHAYMGIVGGFYDLVLVAGVEKTTEATGLDSRGMTQVFATSAHAHYEQPVGLTFPGVFALMACRHMYQYGTTEEQMAAVAVKSHHHGVLNPKAHFRKEITVEQVLASPIIASPFKLFDCCPFSDGAAAVLLASAKVARAVHRDRVKILGIGHASGTVPLHDKADLARTSAAERAAQQAYDQAGLGPQDVDVVELHDCFTSAEIIATEALGLFDIGTGGPAAEEGRTALGGEIPVNPSGGLKAKGHPIGATGAAQIVELTDQLLGRCGERQVDRAEIGLAHNLGGDAATTVVTILGRER